MQPDYRIGKEDRYHVPHRSEVLVLQAARLDGHSLYLVLRCVDYAKR